jgi:hypothetical protein
LHGYASTDFDLIIRSWNFFQSISFLGFKLSRDARLNLGICAAGAVLLALVIWIRGRGGFELADLILFLLITYVAWCILFAVLFRNQVAVKINEFALLAWTLLFWYVVAVAGIAILHPALLLTFLFLTALTLITSFFTVRPHIILRAVLYVWYLIMIVVLGILQFTQLPFSPLAAFALDGAPKLPAPFYMFMAGLIFCYIAIHLMYIVALVPVPYKQGQSVRERLREIKEHIGFMIERYSTRQFHPAALLGLLLIVGGFLAVNYRYGLVSDGLLMGIAIVIITQIAEKYERRDTVQNADFNKSGLQV